MLPALARHLKPTLHSFSAGLADHFVLLVARLWWAAPPDKLFHLPPSRDYEQHNLGGVTARLLLLLLLLLLLSGFGVSFTLNPALWSRPCEVTNTLRLWFASAESTVWSVAVTSPRPFYVLFFQLRQSYVRASVMPLRDMTVERYDSRPEAHSIDGEHMWDSKRRLPPLMLLWYVHKETLKDSQGSLTGIPNKMVCVCAACLWKQIKIILTAAARNVLNLEPQRGEIQQLITPHSKKIPNVPSRCRLKLIQAFSCCVNDKIMFLLLVSDGRRFIPSHLFLSYTCDRRSQHTSFILSFKSLQLHFR